MSIYKRGEHRTQFDGSAQQGSNCTAASLANGAREETDGAHDHSGAFMRAKVAKSEETNPESPGWSLSDADLAARRDGVPFDRGSGGWAGVDKARREGKGVLLQGDSDQFENGTCSGRFDGDHAVYVHPETRTRDGRDEWLLGDPICSDWRWEREATLKAYAEKLDSRILFGVFPTPVPKLKVEEPEMVPLPITSVVPMLVNTAPDGQWFDLDGKTLVGTKHAGYINRPSPYAAGAFRAIYVTPDGGPVRLVLVKPTSSVPVPPPAADPASIAKAKLAGAIEAQAAVRKALGL